MIGPVVVNRGKKIAKKAEYIEYLDKKIEILEAFLYDNQDDWIEYPERDIGKSFTLGQAKVLIDLSYGQVREALEDMRRIRYEIEEEITKQKGETL